MPHLSFLHAFARSRGDGLRQEFLELFASSNALGAPDVRDIASHMAEHMSQAGPNPAGTVGPSLPDNVLPFPAARPADTSTAQSRKQR